MDLSIYRKLFEPLCSRELLAVKEYAEMILHAREQGICKEPIDPTLPKESKKRS